MPTTLSLWLTLNVNKLFIFQRESKIDNLLPCGGTPQKYKKKLAGSHWMKFGFHPPELARFFPERLSDSGL